MSTELSIKTYLDSLAQDAVGLSVIYAEDDPFVSEQVEKFLAKFFTDVRVFPDGFEAYGAWNERKCDILITDIMMPKMDGVELCEKIRELDAEQKIIVISAHNEIEQLMRLINAGVDRFLLKPFDTRRFLRAISVIARELHERAEKIKLESMLHENLNTMQTIMDTMGDALVIVEDGQIVNANKRFLVLAGVPNIETFRKTGGQIDTVFVHAKGYLSHCDNDGLVELLGKGESQKVLIRSAGGILVYMLRQSSISANSHIILFSDVTLMEKDILASRQKLMTNPFTGIPNKAAFLEKLQEAIMIKSCNVILMSIAEYGKITKWQGKDIVIEVERYLASSIKSILDAKGIASSVFFANYNKNCFILLIDPKLASMFIEVLDKTELSYSYQQQNSDMPTHKIPLHIQKQSLLYEKGSDTAGIISEIEKEFGKLTIE